MPRTVSNEKINQAINLMTINNMGQHDIQRVTGISRPYLQKLAEQIGHQFPRNGIEVVGQVCMCTECGGFFRRAPSKLEDRNNLFCSKKCLKWWNRGKNNANYKHGKSSSTFSKWIQNQSEYKEWREACLARDGYKCVVSGRTDDLDVHHIVAKAEKNELSLEISNGLTINREVHRDIHKLMRTGLSYEDCIKQLKKKYSFGAKDE